MWAAVIRGMIGGCAYTSVGSIELSCSSLVAMSCSRARLASSQPSVVRSMDG